MHRGANRGGRNENVTREARFQIGIERTGVRDYEPETIAMHAEASDERVAAGSGLRDGVAVGIHLKEFALLDQSLQALGQFAAAVPLNAEFAQQLLVAGRLLRLASDVAEDGGFGQHQFSVPGSQFSGFDSVTENRELGTGEGRLAQVSV